MTAMFTLSVFAQSQIAKAEGKCAKDLTWSFDGYTLVITNDNMKETLSIPNYDNLKNQAPWTRKKLNVRRVEIGGYINRIGSCAFTGCKNLTDVVFKTQDVEEIGWGAFLNCKNLRNISLPTTLRKIETIAFANCASLSSIKIPDQCRVEDQAYVSCTNVKSVEISSTALLGQYVFAKEEEIDGTVRHSLYNGEVRRLPMYINTENCHEYGLAPETVRRTLGGNNVASIINYDEITSEIDTIVPIAQYTRENTYALIIGNQNYRFTPNVPYAIHDARIFAKYCEYTLGIPSANIHVCEDATKQLINEDEFGWLQSIENRDRKRLIVYYAGHGVPDTKDKNKAYLLPTDVRGSNPRYGISTNDFNSNIGNLAFEQTVIFLDACFSGMNRDHESVTEATRGVEIDAGMDNEGLNSSTVVFSAAQGNETAQGFTEQGHGLFTYYLLKELQYSNGDCTLGSLSKSIKDNVRSTAPRLKLRKSQTPTTYSSDATSNNWENWTF